MLFILGLLGLWRRGTTNYLWCLGMGLAGMILTKETYIIHVGCAAIAVFVTWLSHLINRVPNNKPAKQTLDLSRSSHGRSGRRRRDRFLLFGHVL